MKITSFRTANLNDVDVLAELVNMAYHPEPGIGSWTDETRFVSGTRTNEQSLINLLAKDDSVVLLGLHEDVILACVHLEKSANQAHIGMLAVNPALQGAGIGKQMLDQAEAYARNHFKVEKFVLIVISLRDELIAFYLRRGYHKTDTTIDYTQLCGETCDAKIDGLKFAVLEKLA
ncbi:MAG: GNAT family N-acetyltransferase [Methylococcaceae bacterium]